MLGGGGGGVGGLSHCVSCQTMEYMVIQANTGESRAQMKVVIVAVRVNKKKLQMIKM